MSHFVILTPRRAQCASVPLRSGFPAMNKAWCTAVALAGLVSVFGCGSDEGTTPGTQVTSGFGGGAAAGVGGGATAGTGAGAISCGTATCMTPALPPGLPIMPLPACCANAAMSQCGTMSGGACMPPPAAAPNCPAPMLLGMTLRACCATGNVCGVDASMIGMGCINASAIPGGAAGRPITMCDGTVTQPPPTAAAGTTGGVAGTGAGGVSAVAGVGGASVVGGAGGVGAGGATATSGAGGASATSGAGGASATAGAGGARAGTGGGAAGAAAGTSGRGF